MRKLIVSIVFFAVVLTVARAQIKEVPLRYVHIPEVERHAYQRNQISGKLPFTDDFSVNKVVPDPEKWIDQDVLINNTLAQRPPSFGVATFDGLDENGSPYGGGRGGSDTLTSVPIELGDINSLFLNFQLQPKGFGLKPLERDSFIVEALSPTGNWVELFGTVLKTTVLMPLDPSDDAPDFVLYNLNVHDSLWHDAFQFRFRNRSSNVGLQELWHLDFVSLAEQPNQETFRELAISDAPDAFIRPYTAMPWSHFLGNEKDFVRQEFKVGVYNSSDELITAGNSRLNVIDLSTTARILDDLQLLVTTGVGATQVKQADIDPGYQCILRSIEDTVQLLTNYNYLESPFEVETRYDVPPDETGLGNLSVNDRLSTITIMHDYYAYDDGTAESSLTDQVSGNATSRIAVEFNSTIDDKLNGILINLPRIIENSDDMGFDLRVWIDSLDDTPEFEMKDLRPEFADVYFDTLNPFTTYALRDENDNPVELDIPAGTFYIGWQTTTPISVQNQQFTLAVGFDKNNTEGTSAIWSQINNLPWENLAASNSILKGSLMIRALFADEPPISTTVRNLSTTELVMYPNPATGILNVDSKLSGRRIDFISVGGQRLQKIITSNQVDIQDLVPGLYIVQVVDGEFVYQNRLVKH